MRACFTFSTDFAVPFGSGVVDIVVHKIGFELSFDVRPYASFKVSYQLAVTLENTNTDTQPYM